jgi:hypothetical protein
MKYKRLEQRHPTLAVEVVKDTLYLDRLLSDEAAFLCFDHRGQRIQVGEKDGEGKENLFQQSLLQILEAL